MTRLFRLALVLPLLALAARAVEPMLKISGRDQTATFTAEEFAALLHTELTLVEPHARRAKP